MWTWQCALDWSSSHRVIRELLYLYGLKSPKLLSDFKFSFVSFSSEVWKSMNFHFNFLLCSCFSLLTLCKKFVQYGESMKWKFLSMHSWWQQTKESLYSSVICMNLFCLIHYVNHQILCQKWSLLIKQKYIFHMNHMKFFFM